MTNLLRLVFMIVLLLGVVLTAALLEPEWAQDLCLDSLTVATLQGELFGVSPWNSEFDGQDQLIMKRIHAKEDITKNLINGRLTLFEAAAQFRRLDEELPLAVNAPTIQGTTEDERLCRQVIVWVRARLAANPREASEDFAAQLEQELLRRKQKNGSVQLPVVFASH